MKKYTVSRSLAALTVACTLAPMDALAIDYSWSSASQSSWATSGNWTPNGTPGASDNILTPTTFSNVLLDGAGSSYAVNNFTFSGASSQQYIATGNAATLVIGGTLAKSSAGTLTIRSSNSGQNQFLSSLTVGSLSLAEGTLALGNGSVGGREIAAFTAGSATMTGGTLQLNVGAPTASSIATITNGLTMNGTSTIEVRRVNGSGSTTLSVGSLSGAGTGSTIAVNNTGSYITNATLRMNNATGTSTYEGRIINSTNGSNTSVMSVEKNGAGTQIFNGNTNAYSGTTTINDGTLLINNTAGSGTGTSVVTVNDGGRFGGSGFSTSAITVVDGGILLGGAGVTGEALSLSGDVTFNAGSVIELALGTFGAKSLLARTGGDWAFDANQTFSFVDLGTTTGLYDNIITGLTGSESGLSSIGSWAIANDGWTGTFAYDGSGGIDLTITSLASIPEPSTYATIIGAGILVVTGFRRRR